MDSLCSFFYHFSVPQIILAQPSNTKYHLFFSHSVHIVLWTQHSLETRMWKTYFHYKGCFHAKTWKVLIKVVKAYFRPDRALAMVCWQVLQGSNKQPLEPVPLNQTWGKKQPVTGLQVFMSSNIIYSCSTWCMCRVWLFCIVSIEKKTSVGRIKQRLEDFRIVTFFLVRYRWQDEL